MITFTCTYNNVEIIVKTENVFIGNIVDDFRHFLLAAGFSPENVRDALGDK